MQQIEFLKLRLLITVCVCVSFKSFLWNCPNVKVIITF